MILHVKERILQQQVPEFIFPISWFSAGCIILKSGMLRSMWYCVLILSSWINFVLLLFLTHMIFFSLAQLPKQWCISLQKITKIFITKGNIRAFFLNIHQPENWSSGNIARIMGSLLASLSQPLDHHVNQEEGLRPGEISSKK